MPIASTAPLGTISDRFTRAVHRFAVTEGIRWVDLAEGRRKDDVVQERPMRFTAPEGVVLNGRAAVRRGVVARALSHAELILITFPVDGPRRA